MVERLSLESLSESFKIIHSFVLKTDVMRTVVSAMSGENPESAKIRHLKFCIQTLQTHCVRLKTHFEVVCRTFGQLEDLAQNNVPEARSELDRMLKLFEEECGYLQRNPDLVAADNSAAAGAPAGSAAGGDAAGSASAQSNGAAAAGCYTPPTPRSDDDYPPTPPTPRSEDGAASNADSYTPQSKDGGGQCRF